MRLGTKILLAVGLMATVIAVGFWVARIFQAPTALTESAPEVDTGSSLANTESAPGRTDTPRSVAGHTPAPPPEPAAGQMTAEPAVAGSNVMTEWEDRVDEVLRLDAKPSEVGKKLMAMLPQMPSEGRVEALQHAANLLADEDYEPMGKLLTNPKTPEDEMEILMRDVLNRPNAVKLPLLLEVARTTGHLKAAEAKEILEVFLGESYDNDWEKWQAKVTEFLKESPDLSTTGDP